MLSFHIIPYLDIRLPLINYYTKYKLQRIKDATEFSVSSFEFVDVGDDFKWTHTWIAAQRRELRLDIYAQWNIHTQTRILVRRTLIHKHTQTHLSRKNIRIFTISGSCHAHRSAGIRKRAESLEIYCRLISSMVAFEPITSFRL